MTMIIRVLENSLQAWTDRQLRFDTSKCKTMHLWKRNIEASYIMKNGPNDVALESSTCKNDLEVYVDNKIQCAGRVSSQQR